MASLVVDDVMMLDRLNLVVPYADGHLGHVEFALSSTFLILGMPF